MSGRPKMCPSCGKLMGVDTICPYCGADSSAIGTRLRALGRRAADAEGHATPVTFVMLVLIVGIYLVSMAAGGIDEDSGGLNLLAPRSEVLIDLGALFRPFVDGGQWWRLVTASFLHGNVIHLLFNAFALWMVGRVYEHDAGPVKTLALYLVSGVVGFLFSYAFSSGFAVGASAALSGLIGAIIVRRRVIDGDFSDHRTQVAIQFAISTAVFGLLVARVDNFAHLGGFLAGGALGWLQARFERARHAWLAIAIVVSGVAIVGGTLQFVAAASAKIDDVDRVLACRRKALLAVSTQTMSLRPAAAEDALGCFKALPPQADELAPVSAALQGALQQAWDGRVNGSAAIERKGIEALRVASRDLDTWLEGFAERHGIRLVADPLE
ncbi:MAG: rhomboid family intramembrane serine protease [Deltaproteobacteria bacterium]|nr:rhomboid family intramembrane serine protease [Deltaproteobacteria bacterium]